MTDENKQVEDNNMENMPEETEEQIVQQNDSATGDVSVEELQAQVKNMEEVAKKAQYDYVMLKRDFDTFQRRVEQEAKESKTTSLVAVMEKILPLINQLSYSVNNMPEELHENKWADGVKIVYENVMKSLNALGIQKIATIGEEPDSELHEPLGVEPTDDEKMKGKIIKEYEPGYMIQQGETTRVIKAAKVIVGQ